MNLSNKISDLASAEIMSCYAAYIHQLNFVKIDKIKSFYEEQPEVSEMFVSFFLGKFSGQKSAEFIAAENEKIKVKIASLSSENQSIAKRIMELLNATVRTNFYKEDRNALSIKIKPEAIEGMKRPVLFAEVFVYSEDFEGIHLRAGPVSRGGLRWSNRLNDFRDEIYGLVSTQILKNVIIVPNGSKGGFVIKNESLDAVDCYKNFLRSLLDITDNYIGDEISQTKTSVCYDELDPYLVVAADKGTGTFSDYANEVSKEYDFWLEDAFASGGTSGYGHKDLGITAKGAWESVKRNLKELGTDVNKDLFKVVGIGSMNGDVFGNGMLLSDKILLVAAFNNNSIFIDPNPDPEKSFQERKRLFDSTHGSSWVNYDKSVISEGGGVYPRGKSPIKLTPQMKEMFNISAEVNELESDELIKRFLESPNIDLLWNGGIGTYVKSTSESHESVSDKENDSLRINGKQLKVKTIGEGGNLGLTQAGREEYVINGGNCYTDALDNSAGVSCSDHEVNIKILVKILIDKGLWSESDRVRFIKALTDEVIEDVLKDNILQSQLISATRERSISSYPYHVHYLLNEIFKNEPADKGLEKILNLTEIDFRVQDSIGIIKPELSVIMAYLKMFISKELEDIDSDFCLQNSGLLFDYFPFSVANNTDFRGAIESHMLKKSIIQMQASNMMVNFLGFSGIASAHRIFEGDVVAMANAFLYLATLRPVKAIMNFLSKDHYGELSCQDGYKIFNAFNDLICFAMTVQQSNGNQPIIISEDKSFDTKSLIDVNLPQEIKDSFDALLCSVKCATGLNNLDDGLFIDFVKSATGCFSCLLDSGFQMLVNGIKEFQDSDLKSDELKNAVSRLINNLK